MSIKLFYTNLHPKALRRTIRFGAVAFVFVSLACALSILVGMAWLALLEDDRHRAPRHEVPPSYVYVPFAP
jgi:hypothetical protein